MAETIGEVADELYKVREARLALEKEVGEFKSAEARLKEQAIGLLNEQKLTSGSGGLATISIKPTPVPVVEDWIEVYQYIYENEAYDLLQRRVAVRSWSDRVEEDQASIPGIRTETITKVSLTKSKRG